jgi:3-deoxy-7-phosphoheptulonate synthase
MPLPSPIELKKRLPLNPLISLEIQKHQRQIQSIIKGASPLWALVVGPCSLHDKNSALDYAYRLKELQEKVKKTCFLVMRAHVEKPRTSIGWKGLVYDPYLDGSNKISEGLALSRDLYLKIVELGVPIATEFLEPIVSSYLSDLVSWGFIGARTSSSQIHRQLASSLSMPIGFKNSTDGNLESAIQGALSAQKRHTFIHINDDGFVCQTKSSGNPHSHIVLRGATSSPNYNHVDILKAVDQSKSEGLTNRILIDAAHDNSHKKSANQKAVCHNVLEQCLRGNESIMGLMIESHIKSGNQAISSPYIDPSISITDPCIDWEETEELITLINETLLSTTLACSH